MIRINEPCAEDWKAMQVEGSKRFCESCRCHVHDVAQYTREEIDNLLEKQGTVCLSIQKDWRGRTKFRQAGSTSIPVVGFILGLVALIVYPMMSNSRTTGVLRSFDSEFKHARLKVSLLIEELKETPEPAKNAELRKELGEARAKLSKAAAAYQQDLIKKRDE